MAQETKSHGVSHVMPVKILVGIWVALMVLTFVTVKVTAFDFGNFNLYVALGIALVKATLVAVFFMHLRYDRPFNAIVFLGALLFVVLFISLAMTDSAANHPFVDQGQAKPAKHALEVK